MIAIEHGFLMHSPGPERVLKSTAKHSLQRRAPDEGVENWSFGSFSLGFQYIPRDLLNFKARIKALQALHDTPPLFLFLLLHMFWHKAYQRNYQIWPDPPIISQDIQRKHNSKINQGS